MEQAWNVFVSQDGICALSGRKLTFGTRKRAWQMTASLDRIDSSRGYEMDNIQWIHKRLQFMKNNLTDDEFVGWCRDIVDHQAKLKAIK